MTERALRSVAFAVPLLAPNLQCHGLPSPWKNRPTEARSMRHAPFILTLLTSKVMVKTREAEGKGGAACLIRQVPY